MATHLCLQLAAALKGPGLIKASSRFMATERLPLCAGIIILAKEDVA